MYVSQAFEEKRRRDIQVPKLLPSEIVQCSDPCANGFLFGGSLGRLSAWSELNAVVSERQGSRAKVQLADVAPALRHGSCQSLA